jgi:hypothetical protein
MPLLQPKFKELCNYLNHQVRRLKQIKLRPRKNGAFSHISITIRNVIIKGLKISTMVKIFIEVEKIRTLPRFLLLKEKLLGKREIKLLSKYVQDKLSLMET